VTTAVTIRKLHWCDRVGRDCYGVRVKGAEGVAVDLPGSKADDEEYKQRCSYQ
jgi:hypothetical protein